VADADARSGARIVFLGPPGSGKGTQAARLGEELGVPAISTGDMLRVAVAAGSELGARVEGIMRSGALVDDDTMAEVVRERLRQEDARRGFILDGYPRTAGQAETLQRILDAAGARLDHVISLRVPERELVSRMANRAALESRADDREEVIRERLRVYESATAPLIEHYRACGLLREVDGDRGIDEVAASLKELVA
jgi:adenylate kinase